MLHTVQFCPEQTALSRHHLDAFAFDGAILVKHLLLPQDIAPVTQELARHVNLLEQHHKQPPVHADTHLAGLSERILRLNQEYPGSLAQLQETISHAAGLQQAASHSSLMTALQMLNPAINQKTHTRCRLQMNLPEEESGLRGWHQDEAGSQSSPSSLTLYIPLQRTNFHNGSLLLALGEHQRGFLPHTTQQVGAGQPSIPAETLHSFQRVASAELEIGDVLIFNSNVPHTPRLNRTHAIAFILNLRYQLVSEQIAPEPIWRIGPFLSHQKTSPQKE